MWGARRLCIDSHRDGVAKPSLLTPGQVYRMEIDLVGTSVAAVLHDDLRTGAAA